MTDLGFDSPFDDSPFEDTFTSAPAVTPVAAVPAPSAGYQNYPTPQTAPFQPPIQQQPTQPSFPQPAQPQPSAQHPAPVGAPVAAAPANDVWREAKAPDGRTYYYNKVTRETSWKKPPGFGEPVAAAPVPTPAPAATLTPVATQPQPPVGLPNPAAFAGMNRSASGSIAPPVMPQPPNILPPMQRNSGLFPPVAGTPPPFGMPAPVNASPYGTPPPSSTPPPANPVGLPNAGTPPPFGSPNTPPFSRPDQPQQPNAGTPPPSGTPPPFGGPSKLPAPGFTPPPFNPVAKQPLPYGMPPAQEPQQPQTPTPQYPPTFNPPPVEQQPGFMAPEPVQPQAFPEPIAATPSPDPLPAQPEPAPEAAPEPEPVVQQPQPTPEPEPEPEPEPDQYVTILLLQTTEIGQDGQPVMAEPQIGPDGQPIFVNVQQSNPDGSAMFQPDGSPVLVLMFQTTTIGPDGNPALAQPALDESGQLIFQHVQRLVPKATPPPAAAPAPGSSSPSAAPLAGAAAKGGAFPKLLKVRLPQEQRQVVPFKPEAVLRDVLDKICKSRPFTIDDFICKDKAGVEVDISKTLGELGHEEVTFFTPKAGGTNFEQRDKCKKTMSDIHQANTSLASSVNGTVKTYRDPMSANAAETDKKKKLLTSDQVGQIFASLEPIAAMAKDFAQSLVPHLNAWPIQIDDVFRKHMEIIPVFSAYLNNFKNVMNVLEELRSNPAVDEYLNNIQRTTGSKLRLEDFLTLPAQKIIALATLVDEMAAAVGDTHPDFLTLKEFAQKLAPLCQTAAVLKRTFESRAKIRFIESNVEGLPKKQSLLDETGERVFYREGLIDMAWKKSKKPVSVRVFVFTDLMLICEEKKDKKKGTLIKFDDICHFTVSDTIDESAGSYQFTIVSGKKDKQSYQCTITSQTEGTKADWVASVKAALDDLRQKPNLANKSSK